MLEKSGKFDVEPLTLLEASGRDKCVVEGFSNRNRVKMSNKCPLITAQFLALQGIMYT